MRVSTREEKDQKKKKGGMGMGSPVQVKAQKQHLKGYFKVDKGVL